MVDVDVRILAWERVRKERQAHLAQHEVGPLQPEKMPVERRGVGEDQSVSLEPDLKAMSCTPLLEIMAAENERVHPNLLGV